MLEVFKQDERLYRCSRRIITLAPIGQLDDINELLKTYGKKELNN